MNEYHVIPLNDTAEHISKGWCNCKPIYRDGIYIHNAHDKRELIEHELYNIGLCGGGWAVYIAKY